MTFPTLKTKAVAQYPAGKTLEFRNQTLRFVDGAQQRYRDSAGVLGRWTIRLDQLDETEMSAMAQFFREAQGRLGSFAFTDPWDGTLHPNCSLAADDLEMVWQREMNGRTTVTVMENRD